MKNIILILILVLFSCKSNNFSGKSYMGSNKEEIVKIKFINDSICEVKQEFLCEQLKNTYRIKRIYAKYKVVKLKINSYDKKFKPIIFKSNALIINNLECKKCEKYYLIPNYEENCMNTIKLDTRFKNKIKMGVIYNMIQDTVLFNKKEIIFGNLKLTPSPLVPDN
jgi:hypothetical protein